VTEPRVVIIGVGNPWRGDDGAGWVAADLAAARLSPGADIVHSDGVVDAVRLGAAVGRLPRRLVVFGIEVADTGPGRGLTPDVARAAQTVAHSIEHEAGTSRPGRLGGFRDA